MNEQKCQEKCPICKKPLAETEIGVIFFVLIDKPRLYHYICYRILYKRLQNLWDVLTGPQEEFDRWLEEPNG